MYCISHAHDTTRGLKTEPARTEIHSPQSDQTSPHTADHCDWITRSQYKLHLLWFFVVKETLAQ